MPRFNSIAAYKKAIEEGNKKLDELAHKKFQAMLRNDVPGMNALDKQYKDTERYLGSLKAELGEVMGAGIHGKKGNQLTGSGWFGRKMGELSADGEKVRVTQLGYPDGPPPMPQRPPVPEGNPDRDNYEKNYKEILDGGETDREDDTSGASYGGGYADFFREQREGDASEDTRKDTGYEYISKQDFDSKLALLDTRLGWNAQWMDEADGKLAVNPNDESARRVYNSCLQNVIELKKQINELNEQRAWSEKVEMSDIPGNSNGFDNPDEAAIAFLKMHQGKSQEGNREYGVVIYESGGRYYLGQTHAGEEGSVASIFGESVLSPSGIGKVVGTVHTHPREYTAAGIDSDNNSFSGMDMFLPGIRYLGAPNGTIYRNDDIFKENTIVLQGLPSVGKKDGGVVYSNQPLDVDLNSRFPVLMRILDINPLFRSTLEKIGDQMP